jgi:hypothetical protein
VSQNLRTPNMTNWSVGITHAITNNLSLEISYVGNHGANMTGFVDLNQAPLGAGYCLNALTPAQLTGACGTGPVNARVPAACIASFSCALSGAAEQQARPFNVAFPYLRFVNMTVNDARSNYHSLQSTLTERVTHGLSFTAGYTLGHGLDNGSLNRFGNLPQDSGNPGLEYGNSDFDIRNRFTITATYDLPGIKGFGQLLEGWKVNTIVSISGRMPWLVNDQGNDLSGTGDLGDRWNITGNPGDFNSGPDSFLFCTDPASKGGGCAQYSGPYAQSVAFCGSTPGPCSATTSAALWKQCTSVDNPASPNSTLGANGCFVSGSSVITPQNLGTYGNMGRNIFRDSGFKNVDFSVFKTFTYKERYSAQLRAEVFNLFNHPIISNPYGAANGGLSGNDPSSGKTFGCGCGTPDVVAGNPLVGSGSSRVLQVGLKLQF